MRCQRCAGSQFTKAGRDRAGRQIHECATCARHQTDRSTSAFRGYRFPDDLIALAVRWYLRFRLPYADLVELLAERGVHVDASTICDWVQRFTPLYQDAARAHRHRVGVRWAVDETYIRMAGRWVYAYRASDEHGQVVDVYLSETRDTAAATTFFERAIDHADVRPQRVTTDKAPAYPPALRAVVPEAEHLTGKMEQQGIERDHQHLKGRTRSMRGFQHIDCAQVCVHPAPSGRPRQPRQDALAQGSPYSTHVANINDQLLLLPRTGPNMALFELDDSRAWHIDSPEGFVHGHGGYLLRG